MYIIVSYVSASDPASIHVVYYSNSGQPALFESEADAIKYAEEACCWKYKIVQL